MYTELFDGLRGYYASYRSRRADAGYNAAMTLSFIFGCNLGSVITLTDFALHKNLTWSVEFFANKVLLVGIGIGIAFAHVLFGKRTGRYSSIDPSNSSKWKGYMWVYASASIFLLLSSIIVAFILKS
jgi:hypothetical protein